MITETLEELIDNFSLFDEWEDRYRYLIDLGRKLPEIDGELKKEEFLVKGCTSRVWLVPEVKDGALYFEADSDAHIVRGLVAILYAAYNGKNLEEVRGIDIISSFQKIGMDQHLSANRRNGFFSMVEVIKSIAE